MLWKIEWAERIGLKKVKGPNQNRYLKRQLISAYGGAEEFTYDSEIESSLEKRSVSSSVHTWMNEPQRSLS